MAKKRHREKSSGSLCHPLGGLNASAFLTATFFFCRKLARIVAKLRPLDELFGFIVFFPGR